MNEQPYDKRSIRIYVALQTLTLIVCWGWFAGLWSLAFFQYDLGDVRWWVLVATACMGLYGLRPNLERAIDTAWLRGVTNTKALAERVAQLKPIKRRIDLLFSTVVLMALLIATILWLSGSMDIGGGIPQ